MILLICFLCIAILLLAIVTIKYIFLLREIKRVTKEIVEAKNFDLSHPILINHHIKTYEKFIIELNKRLSLYWSEYIRLGKAEKDYKKAIEYISHDIRTPLTATLGYIELIKLKGDPDGRYLEIVRKNCKSLGELLDDFFEVSKLEANDVKMEISEFDIFELSLDVFNQFVAAFEEKKIVVTVIPPKNELVYNVDSHYFKRIIYNVLNNVYKYGEDSIEIIFSSEEKEIIIKNKTEVINKNDIKHVFDRMYMAKFAKDSRSGSGFGLYIANELAKKMDGQMTASLFDKTFSIKINFK